MQFFFSFSNCVKGIIEFFLVSETDLNDSDCTCKTFYSFTLISTCKTFYFGRLIKT